MIIERIWAMPNKSTFSIKPIAQLLHEELDDFVNDGTSVIIDPFSNGFRFSENSIINDLNSEIEADTHMDALDFLKMFGSESVDAILYDPPYSIRQVAECYKGFGMEVAQETTQFSWRTKHFEEIKRILKPGGKVLCFGWNSGGVGKKRGFTMQRVLLVPHGGGRHDTICTVEIKQYSQQTLF